MKSMLQEASSVAKAVDQAWRAAGCPAEFTIKVLQQEVRGFLGCFTKNPAIVSIFYDPRKQGSTVSEQKGPTRRSRSPEPRVASSNTRHEGSARRERERETDAPEMTATEDTFRENRGRERRSERYERSERPERYERGNRDTRRTRSDRSEDSDERASWNDVYLLDIGDWLKELLVHMDMPVRFSISVDRQMLRIQLADPLIESSEFERHVCASLATLLLQFLRRKYTGKCYGLRLLILSSRQESSKDY